MRREAFRWTCERRYVRQRAKRLAEHLLCLAQESHCPKSSSGSLTTVRGLVQEKYGREVTLTGMKWIYKPADGNKASGIKIFRDVQALTEFCHELDTSAEPEDRKQVGVIQEYLEHPWLLEYAYLTGPALAPAATFTSTPTL
jgi:hypothetical protein